MTDSQAPVDRWVDPETGRRYPKCDGCAQPIVKQAEHDKVCGWSAVKHRTRF